MVALRSFSMSPGSAGDEVAGKGHPRRQVSFRGAISVAGSLVVAITGFFPLILSDYLNTRVVVALSDSLREQVLFSIRREVLDVTEQVRSSVERGGKGVFSEDGAVDFGCCSAADEPAKNISGYERVRRYHWENLETNGRVLLSFTGTVAGSILLLARTDDMRDIDGSGARQSRGNLQWTLSDATTNYTYHQYYSNTWHSGNFAWAATSECGQGYVKETGLASSTTLASEADCQEAARSLFPGLPAVEERSDGSAPFGCYLEASGNQVVWNPSGNATLQDVTKKALCRLPDWYPRQSIFEPDCGDPWPCYSGEYHPVVNSTFDPELFEICEPQHHYNATERSWWKGALRLGADPLRRGKPGWSQVYLSRSTSKLVLPCVLPLYAGTTDVVRAVTAVGLGVQFLDSFIHERLQAIDGRASGWIVDVCSEGDRPGRLIASSPTSLSIVNGDQIFAHRAEEAGPSGAYIQAVSRLLKDMHGGWLNFPTGSDVELEHQTDHGMDLVQATRLSDGHGLEWVIVIAVPREIFFQGLRQARTWTVASTVTLTCLMGGILFAISCAITRHIRRLGDKMSRVSRMDLEVSGVLGTEAGRRPSLYSEVGSMEASFRQMSRKLKAFWEAEQDRMAWHVDERHRRDSTRVCAAIRDADELRHPMVLCKAEVFLELGRLASYEELRDVGKLVVLDTIAKVNEFVQDHSIIFFSHQWLDWGKPDPNNVHHAAMASAIQQLQGQMSPKRGRSPTVDDMYIWCDYSSISQEHRCMQMLAISSLPVYSSKADAFVVIAPTTEHASGEMCGLKSYDTRGWCRMETLSKVCGSGISNMFLMTSKDGQLEKVTMEMFRESLSLRVFEGSFSCCARGHERQPYCDKEKLVESVLGLYYRLLRHESDPASQMVLEHIRDDEERFFPAFFRFSVAGQPEDETRELFGELVGMMETRVSDELHASSEDCIRGWKSSCRSIGSSASSSGLAAGRNRTFNSRPSTSRSRRQSLSTVTPRSIPSVTSAEMWLSAV